MARPIQRLTILPADREVLEQRVRSDTTSRRDCLRARKVLLHAEGRRQREIAARLGVSSVTVSKWSRRFELEGVAGLLNMPGRGREPFIPVESVAKAIEQAGRAPPGQQRWSTRSMAAQAGISASGFQRLWNKQGLEPHLTKTRKLVRYKPPEPPFWDVIGLYLDPPQKPVVLCCDGKSPTHAPERPQPTMSSFSVRSVHPRIRDETRQGTGPLFAAVSYLEGKLAHRAEPQPTHVKWLRFLRLVDREISAALGIDLITDSCSEHH